jgi:hypothetical protein
MLPLQFSTVSRFSAIKEGFAREILKRREYDR